MSRLDELNAIIDEHSEYGLGEVVLWIEPNSKKVIVVHSHVDNRMKYLGSKSEWVTDGDSLTLALPDEPVGTLQYEHHISDATYAIQHVSSWHRGPKTETVGSLVLCENTDPDVLRQELDAIYGYSFSPTS